MSEWDKWLDAYGEVVEQRGQLATVITGLLFAIDNADFTETDPKKQLEYIRSVRYGESVSNCLTGIEA